MKKIIFFQLVFSLLIAFKGEAQLSVSGGGQSKSTGLVENEESETTPQNSLLAPGDKKVFWVHGLRGSEQTWQASSTWYAANYKMKEYRPHYVENNGIDVAAHQLGEVFSDLTANDPASSLADNLAICHSQGGVVVRGLDKRTGGDVNAMRFGAFVTASTPNMGAPIINSLKDGAHTRLLDDMYGEMTAGPAASMGFFLDILGISFDQYKEKVVLALADMVGNSFVAPTTEDFYVGAPYITNLNNTQSSTPRAHIVGIEEDPVHWRVLSCYTMKSPSERPFNEVGDGLLMDKMNKVRQHYIDKSSHYNALYAVYTQRWQWIFGGATHLVAVISDWDYKAKQWQRGATSIDDFGDKWLRIIGAFGEQTRTFTLSPFACCEKNNCDERVCIRPAQRQSCVYNCSVTLPVTVKYDSDGVVPVPNQELPGSYKRFEARGANHAEVCNHPAAATAFEQIFSGTSVSGNNANRFKVARR